MVRLICTSSRINSLKQAHSCNDAIRINLLSTVTELYKLLSSFRVSKFCSDKPILSFWVSGINPDRSNLWTGKEKNSLFLLPIVTEFFPDKPSNLTGLNLWARFTQLKTLDQRSSDQKGLNILWLNLSPTHGPLRQSVLLLKLKL